MSVIQEFEEKHKIFNEATIRNRHNALNAVYKIMLLSGSIVAFSLTLVSTNLITAKIDLRILVDSWFSFLVVIIIGTLMLFIEPRIEQLRAWRYYKQYAVSPTNDEIKKLTFREKIEINQALFKSLIFPENSIFDKVQESEEATRKNQIKSAVLLYKIVKIRTTVYVLEMLFYIAFIISLILFIKSIKL